MPKSQKTTDPAGAKTKPNSPSEAPKSEDKVPVSKSRTYAKRLVQKAAGTAKPSKVSGKSRTAPKVDPAVSGLAGRRTSTRQLAAGPDDPKYTDINPSMVTGFLAALSVSGRPTQVARDMRLHYMSLRALYHEDPGFKKSWDLAMSSAFEHHEDEVRRRAFEGYEKKVFQQGMLVGTQTEYSDTLAVMMIKAGKPEIYNPKTVSLIEHAGSVAVAYANLTDEQLNDAINEKLRFLGSLPIHTGEQPTAAELDTGEVKPDDVLDVNELNRSAGDIDD